MITRRLLVSGRVQGVFYRAWTEATARRLGLRGWVRNLRSGDVEVLATGSPEAVDRLVRLCRDGPPAASVQDIEVSEAEPEPGEGFHVRPTA